MRLRPNFLDTKSYDPRTSQSFDFLTVFLLQFLTFLENYAPKSEILGSIRIPACVNPFCISGSVLLFHKKSMILGNVNILIC